jgi:predicted amidohydrolase
MQDIRVSVIQTDLFWEDPIRNLEKFDRLIDLLREPTDLILLPEMFNTGFSINPEVFSEAMDGPSVRFLTRKSAETGSAIMATILARVKDQFYNRLIVMFPDGSYHTYDKRHLFRLSEENKIISAGNTKLTVNIKGWKIRPLICYDLRFPVWSKNTYSEGEYEYDLLVCLANWPANRSRIWKSLIIARAIENQSYFAGVNRIGEDGHGTPHTGDSLIADAKGNILYCAEAGRETTHTQILNYKDLQLYRESFTVGMDWDQFFIIA